MGKGQKFYGWKLVGALWAIYLLNMGFVLYGGVVIHSYMLKQIVMDRATYGLGFTLHNFFVGVPSMLVAAAIIKWGIRKTFWLGCSLLVVGTLWMAFFASEPWHYLVGFGVILGAGLGSSTIIPLSTAVTRWFVRYRGRAMAVAMTASGFAGFIAAPLMNKLMAVNGGDWRQAWLFVCGLSIVSMIIVYLFVKERPEELGQTPDGVDTEAPTTNPSASALVTTYPWTTTEAYRTRSMWLILAGAVACQYPFFFFTAHWMPHLRGVGIDPANAAWAMGLFTMGGIGGRLLGGWLMDRMAARYAFMLGLCCYFVGSYLAMNITASTFLMACVAAILYGAGFGWTFVCQNTITGNFYGPKAFPKVNGTIMTLTAIIGSGSGVIGGKLFDMYKSYTPAFELNIAIALVGVIALFFATMPKAPTVQKIEEIQA